MTDKQRIVEHLAQPDERMADRRLADVEALRGPPDVPLGHQRLEHHQQVQVDTAKIDLIHDVDV